ncbi:MAG: hypothetical protein KA369_10640 [Spirochaetes bacterium]|nr:hypothetical protein [Spirochaetota bacterium]
MQRRKQMIINKQFQIKTTFSIIGIVTLLAVAIITAIAISVWHNNRKIEQINVMEDNIVQYLQVKSLSAANVEVDQKAMKEIAVNHSKNMTDMAAMIRLNRVLLLVLIVIMIVQGVVLYMLLIRKTHRIAGPIFVMSRYMQEIIDGKHPSLRQLRKNDEFKEFYSLFSTMVESIKNRGK